jgi:hypothetical protein
MFSPFVVNNLSDSSAISFLESARNILSIKEHSLLSDILLEWHSSTTLSHLISRWIPFKKSASQASFSFLNILCFNVRGLERRWGEVCLLSSSHRFDILVLGEVGRIDFSLVGAAFPDFRYFYQSGGNAHGGILVLVHNSIPVSQVSCALPNVCVIDLHMEESTRIVALYAPASKAWNWSDLSPFISARCVVMGDFNVDLERDGDKADSLLGWMDSHSLGPFVPDSNTSLRSDRTIDYALAVGIDVTIQTHEVETTSDHKPLICVLACEGRASSEGRTTMWKVFSTVLSYTFTFWEKQWNFGMYDETYDEFIAFLSSLAARCTSHFPLKKARSALPPALRALLAQSRTLAFKAKRKGDVMLRNEAHRLRNMARGELKRFQQDQLVKLLKNRNLPGEPSTRFWSKTKRHFRDTSASLRGFILPNGESEKDPQVMAETAADYYEELFDAPSVMRPHPYVDSPVIHWDNAHDPIPLVTYPEILKILATRKKKRSCDIHGLSSYLLEQLPRNY